MTTHLHHIVLTCRGAPVDTSGGDLEGGKQIKVRNVIRGGAVVAASAALVSVGGGMGLTASHSSAAGTRASVVFYLVYSSMFRIAAVAHY